MILVDTSIWIDHLHSAVPELSTLLLEDRALGHPYVVGELALGNIADEQMFIDLGLLPQAMVADPDEVLHFIRRAKLRNTGIGYVDAHLLAAVRLMPDATIWTRDRKLRRVATDLSIAAPDLD